jgi:DNA-binding LytR/AlgR family response regulator
VSNISHINASDNYSEIVTIDKQKFTASYLLKDFEFYLKENPFFVRINRNTIVNTSNIDSYTKSYPCIVEMKCGCSFEISRRRKAEVLKLLEFV